VITEDFRTATGLARIAASTWWRTSGWALRSSLKASARLAQAAVSPSSAAELADDVRRAARSVVRDLVDVADVDMARRVVDAVPSFGPEHEGGVDGDPNRNGHRSMTPSLRAEGEELLRKSRDVHYVEEAHPAYERILSELAPDEGRILRLLLFDGPQPAVDIRTGGPVGMVRSRLVAPGLSMIGARAGCRYVERVPAYLNNLFRLGLVWFSRETLNDPLRYQVLEAQPDVLAGINSVRQAKVVRRSIHLTPFGEDFCRVCLTPETGPPSDLPAHSAPPEATRAPQPPAMIEPDRSEEFS
jgi:abortive infection alpha-like protein